MPKNDVNVMELLHPPRETPLNSSNEISMDDYSPVL